MSTKIWLSSPHMSGEEINYINEAFNNNWIAPLGPNVDNFEMEIASYLNVQYCAALCSGTAAIHLALIILGVKADDYVICSSFTFSGSANPITYLKANPVFIDSEFETWNMDPILLKKAIVDLSKKGKKPKAIIVVHLYGMPAKMEEILLIAKEYSIPIIEDAAESLGSSYKGTKLGAFGNIGILSFNGNKIITTSGGGALISNREDYVEKAKFLATQARDNTPHYEHSQIGYNYRMSNILAGIGRGQLKVIDERIERKRYIFNYYKKELSAIKGISFQDEPDSNFNSNYWLTTIIIDPQKTNKITCEDIRKHLLKDNIESRPLWKPMHLQPVFVNCNSYVNGVSKYLFQNGLCLPSGTNLSDDDLCRIVRRIKEVL